MPDSVMKWTVPVEIKALGQRRDLAVTVKDGDLVLSCLGQEVVLPPASDHQLHEAVDEARAVQQQMGRRL